MSETQDQLARIYDRHLARIEKLIAERDVAHAEIERLRIELADLRTCHKEHYEGMLAEGAENERARALLKSLEWAATYNQANVCPVCYAEKWNGITLNTHKPLCALSAALNPPKPCKEEDGA